MIVKVTRLACLVALDAYSWISGGNGDETDPDENNEFYVIVNVSGNNYELTRLEAILFSKASYF